MTRILDSLSIKDLPCLCLYIYLPKKVLSFCIFWLVRWKYISFYKTVMCNVLNVMCFIWQFYCLLFKQCSWSREGRCFSTGVLCQDGSSFQGSPTLGWLLRGGAGECWWSELLDAYLVFPHFDSTVVLLWCPISFFGGTHLFYLTIL